MRSVFHLNRIPFNPKWSKLQIQLAELFINNCDKFGGNCARCSEKTNYCKGAIEAYGKYIELNETGY